MKPFCSAAFIKKLISRKVNKKYSRNAMLPNAIILF